MNKKPKMSIKKGKIARIILGFFLYLIVLLVISSCRSSEANKWTPPKFIKEWEIKEIKPGLPHCIVSMTANKNGVFVLVKAVEVKYTPPKKMSEMTEKEKEVVIDFMKRNFGKILSDEERMNDTGTFGETEEINHFRIQHYDFEGNFLNHWPEGNRLILPNSLEKVTNAFIVRRYYPFKEKLEIDSRDYLIKPQKIVSDDLSNFYLADYVGNKIVKFGPEGNILSLWMLDQKKKWRFYDSTFTYKGIAIAKDRLYIVSEGFDEKIGDGIRIYEYDLNGKLIKEKIINPPKVPTRIPIIELKIPFFKEEANVSDIVADNNRNLYLFAPDTTILVLDNQWNEKRYIRTVLKKGFERPKPVYDPDMKREIRYDKMFKGLEVSFSYFSSEKLSWIEREPGAYYANAVHLSPEGEIYVSFIGAKPFGVIDAIIFNKEGKMIGYWKHQRKSYSEWFVKLTDLQQIEMTDIALDIAFFGDNIFIGRTLEEGRGQKKDRTVIQKYIKGGKIK